VPTGIADVLSPLDFIWIDTSGKLRPSMRRKTLETQFGNLNQINIKLGKLGKWPTA
jgi:hypothetical protein